MNRFTPLLLLIIQLLASVEIGLGWEMRIRVPESNAYAPTFIQDESGRWVYFGVSKKSVPPELLDRIRDAYVRAKAKGSFEAIRKKYVIEPD
jgi:ABC-type amino acid transport substrate-binding protein